MSSSACSSSAPNPSEPSIKESLYQVKLLEAFRSGDPALIHPLLAEIGKEKRKFTSDESSDLAAAALHLAIRCASCETVQLLLSHRSISPNGTYPPGSGTTPLHLAASIGRADIVNLLLEQDGIDDTLRDAHGRTCRDVALGKEVAKAIRDSRALLTAHFRSLLHSYIHSPMTSPTPPALLTLLASPRVRLVDLSYLDEPSGRSLLHEAARRRDLRLIERAICAGADVFVRDRRGKGVGEGVGLPKDDKVRVFLRQYTNQDTSLVEEPSSEPPSLKGYLSKYTNVAKGYNTRWFVLKNGVLSYYRLQEDENVASRGAIAMKSAILKISPDDRLRFEIHSTPNRAGSSSGQQKWYIKGNHVAEVNRWVQALTRAIEGAKGEHGHRSPRGEVQESESERRSLRSIAHNWRHRNNSDSSRSKAPGIASAASKSTASSLLESGDDRDDRLGRNGTASIFSPDPNATGAETDYDDTEADRLADDSSDSRSEDLPPHGDTFVLEGHTAVAQVELAARLAQSVANASAVAAPAVSGHSSSYSSSSSLTSTSASASRLKTPSTFTHHQQTVQSALVDALNDAQRLVAEYVSAVAEREEWWKAKLEKERARGVLWEESLQMVVKEGQEIENELRARMRKRGSRLSTDGEGRTLRRASMTLVSPPPPPVDITKAGMPVVSEAPETAEAKAGIASSLTIAVMPPPLALAAAEEESVVDTDEEDEFFDAIESNLLPNVVVPDALVPMRQSLDVDLERELPPYVRAHVDEFVGYRKLREKLPIENDTRPPTSLWSVLKHSIGMDLTRITLPVFFNEPTSMLQRMAEDMEFSECLDAAAAEPDPLKRIAFVAAFAMSNYSSTIRRIAKPFNPMLGETFEYVRLDKRYRYVSEQVSHHPPVSACWAEAPSWHYFGEVDAQNRFMGKSFEIRPTGVAHAELFVPEQWGGPHYPKAKGPFGDGKVAEHYSWKKVTTNVSGFILGSPTIDHYGDMEVLNHRTGDTCILTFKPRGWRGKDAFEIYGKVMDAQGNITHEIAGRWNSQLVARAVGDGFGELHPDVSVSGPSSPSASSEFVRLWRNTEKPSAPFNLTPFAITLNDCPEDTLKPYICPTDCRLRPDQRAFELGKYERANELKLKQEELQRATRRAREEGIRKPHQPRWFEARTEVDTGERVWEPLRVEDGQVAYWREREIAWKERNGWREVEPIFIDDEP